MDQQALLSRINELPKIKKILQELVEMVNQDDVDFDALIEKIAMEQVISARILRMSNSAHFGRSRTIGSIDEAVIRLGIAPVKTLIVVSVLSSAFPKFETLNTQEYWSDTFEVATIASKLGEKAGLNPNEVFTAGILHNIGELMIHTLVPDMAKEIVDRVAAGEEALTVQDDVLATTSAKLGAKLASAWKFSPQLVDAIEYQATPAEADNPQLATLIHFASQINRDWDELEDEEAKHSYIAESPDASTLSVPPECLFTLDEIRGQGRSIAAQMA